MKIKRIGFDIDNTLYKQSPEMRESVRMTISKKIAENISVSIGEAKLKLEEGLEKYDSTSKTMRELGIEDPKSLIWEALQETDVSPFVRKDEKLLSLLLELKKKGIVLDLITAREEVSSKKILECLGVPLNIFDYKVYAANKKEVTPFIKWHRYTKTEPSEIAYVGDDGKADVQPIKMNEILKNIIVVHISKEKDPLADFQISEIYEVGNLF